MMVQRVEDGKVMVGLCSRDEDGLINHFVSNYGVLTLRDFEAAKTLIVMRPNGNQPPVQMFVRIEGEVKDAISPQRPYQPS